MKENQMLFPRVPPSNREYKRKLTGEFNRILPSLLGVEAMFVDHLFESQMEYEELYIHFLGEYRRTIKELKRQKPSFKFVIFNENYFEQNYHPKEKL